MKIVNKNSFRAWLLAMRPKTLAAGSVPVLVASALAQSVGSFRLLPAVLCLAFALLAQIASNFANDYFDFVKKTDDETRLGPARAVASGWISPQAMLRATLVAIVLACFAGLGLIAFGGWTMIIVGALCILALLAYTAGPYPLAYHGLGDVFVLVFFGLVAVVFSFFVQAGYFFPPAFIAGAVVGLGAVNILVVNNFRDRDTDRTSNKHTTIVIFGEVFGNYFYLINGIAAVVLCAFFFSHKPLAAILPLGYLPFHFTAWKKMRVIWRGRELNRILGRTAANLLLLGVLLSVGLLID
ncbi:MAG: 1,4-dihydroxy-2-naphthoate polyprenyltransferase [Prevotellaceae bacterium]|jgi:1,4-dihydroxy-2-naphthoate octaprenyltransferase|nr:1,4-dihydroxy-2-naphthoate polyprenyltransferase [Prevotellaceae bacterium]